MEVYLNRIQIQGEKEDVADAFLLFRCSGHFHLVCASKKSQLIKTLFWQKFQSLLSSISGCSKRCRSWRRRCKSIGSDNNVATSSWIRNDWKHSFHMDAVL